MCARDVTHGGSGEGRGGPSDPLDPGSSCGRSPTTPTRSMHRALPCERVCMCCVCVRGAPGGGSPAPGRARPLPARALPFGGLFLPFRLSDGRDGSAKSSGGAGRASVRRGGGGREYGDGRGKASVEKGWDFLICHVFISDLHLPVEMSKFPFPKFLAGRLKLYSCTTANDMGSMWAGEGGSAGEGSRTVVRESSPFIPLGCPITHHPFSSCETLSCTSDLLNYGLSANFFCRSVPACRLRNLPLPAFFPAPPTPGE